MIARRLDLVRMLRSASSWLVAAAVATALLAGVLPVAVILAGGLLAERIDEIVRSRAASPDFGPVYEAFALVMGLFLLGEILVPLQNRLRWLVTKRVDGAARLGVMRGAMLGTDMTRLHREEYLEAMGRARGLIRWSATPGAGAAGMIGVSRDYLTGFAATAVVAWFQPLIAAATLAVGLLIRSLHRASVIRTINIWLEGLDRLREGWYFAELGLGRTAAKEVRLFGLREWLRQRIHTAGIAAWTPTWRERDTGMRRSTTIGLVLAAAVSIPSLVWAARAASHDQLGIGGLVVFVPALFAVLGLGRHFNDDVPVEYGTSTLPAIRALERLAASTVEAEVGRRPPARDKPPAIQLHDVTFSYPGGARVVDGVTLEVASGGSAALVGMNGAGKTTLIRLVCGLYPPDRGAVLVNGTDLRQLDLAAWHALIAPMFQEFLRVPATIGENVAVGAVEHLGDRPAIERVLAEAGAHRFAERLPDGIDSLLATRYADGTDLSGGQWQRLGIARALFALDQGARVLLLDEPTSNLDTSSEEHVVSRLLDGTRGQVTTMLVTHRLALARRTDRIYVVEHGRVIEEGTHAELLRAGGRYADAFLMQASLYPLEEADGRQR